MRPEQVTGALPVRRVRCRTRALKQFVLKPTVFCYHRCPYCDLGQDHCRDMVAERKRALRILPRDASVSMPNP